MRSVVACVTGLILVLSACGSGPDAAPSGATADAMTTSAATATERELGPDPGSIAYRSLDVCALVSVATLQAAYAADGGSGSVSSKVSGPASCDYSLSDSGAWAGLQLDSPREQLPSDVRTTDVGVNKVDSDSSGVIVYDPAMTSLHVLSTSGYLLRVTGPGDSTDAQRLALALAKQVRQRLTEPPPTLALQETEVSGRDLCEAVHKTDLLASLGLQGDVESSVDGRLCVLPKQFWVGFHGQRGYPEGLPGETVRIGSVTAEIRPELCQLVIPIHGAPKNARWPYDSLLARPDPQTGPSCDRFIRSLAPLVDLLAKKQ